MIKKMINVLKENFKIIIPLTLILVIFISFFIYYKVSISDNYREYKNIKAYQYFYDEKYEYNAKIGLNRKKEIVEFETKDYDINFDSTPIYYENKNKVIFPQNMSVVMPTLSCSEYLSPKYSLITKKKANYFLKTTKYENKLGHYFLYDGLNLYFFLDEVKLTINNQEIKLSPLSYVQSSKVNSNISYYDKATDTYKTIAAKDYKTTAESNYYKVNINTDQIDYFGENINLTSQITSLNTINMKDKK
ncbi:MAG: hypothetical protein IKF19_06820 [Bacilli bacterium]|nr:hypothetical protein [Bacilli bacterium]